MKRQNALQVRLIAHRDHQHLLDTRLAQQDDSTFLADLGNLLHRSLVEVEKRFADLALQDGVFERQAYHLDQVFVLCLVLAEF